MEGNKYLGLLKWSLKYNDGTKETDLTPMSKERRDWLKEAMEEQLVDPAQEMKLLINILKIKREDYQKDKENESISEEELEKEFVEKKVSTLELLLEWVESIDWAMDLHKLGGFETVILLMKDKNENIRTHSMNVFATTVQNNPKCQEWAMELNALPILVNNLNENKDISENEQAKNLLSISCLVREHSKASVTFIKEYKGIALLLKIIAGGNGEIKVFTKGLIKALFLMRYYFNNVPVIKLTLADSIVIALNITMVSENVDVCEHSLHLLKSIYEDQKTSEKLKNTKAKKDTLDIITKYFGKDSKHFVQPRDENITELANTVVEFIKKTPVTSKIPLADDQTPPMIKNL